jgi:hypothetical protein
MFNSIRARLWRHFALCYTVCTAAATTVLLLLLLQLLLLLLLLVAMAPNNQHARQTHSRRQLCKSVDAFKLGAMLNGRYDDTLARGCAEHKLLQLRRSQSQCAMASNSCTATS